MPRVILVSNRLPVAARIERGELVVSAGAGGVASGLAGFHERGQGVWIGWPGETWRMDSEQRDALDERLTALRAVSVDLTAGDVERYYESFANGILWPLLHYELERLPTYPSGWESYKRVNERFADAVVSQYRPGDLIWIHDYQLMLVPGLVRRRLPGAAIGFFLHVPFPSSELFRVLRWRRELLEGMLGATLVGFHTASYAGHFMSSASKILGCEISHGRVLFEGRRVRVGAFPMGIDAAAYEDVARSETVAGEVARLARTDRDVRLVVSVDRLDYTKGIPRRLLAFERLLEHYPSWRRRVRLVQVAAPSREAVGAYRDYRRTVDELVGRLHGRFATVGHDPIRYISRTLPRERLVALYRAAAVALVTPLRDGMNLVSKEFVASRVDDDGVLVLSEFAGAAAELSGALLVNPFDLDDVAGAIHRALEMPIGERQDRMRTLRSRVSDYDVYRWAREFTTTLRDEQRRVNRVTRAEGTAEDLVRPLDIVDAIEPERAGPLSLVLDYDGTIVPLRPRPEDARPDDEILRMLDTLAALPEVRVDVVSGRRRADLESWLGHLPLGLHAEHGLWSRSPGESQWRSRMVDRPSWLAEIRPRLDAQARTVPGSFVEEKEASLAWHYRTAEDATAGTRGARDLRRELAAVLEPSEARVVPGSRVVEVRQAGLHKGLVVDEVRGSLPGAKLVVVGDDVTDEDMFAAAPPDAVTVKVGSGRTKARFRLGGPDQVRALLAEIARRRGGNWELDAHPAESA
jgi:trehalose 6-phosphate synthase/phosphatase